MAHLTGHCLALFSLVIWCLCILMPGQDYSSFTKREQVQNSSILQNSSTLSATFPTNVKAVSSNSSTSTSTSRSSSVSSSSATVVVSVTTQTEISFTTSSSTKTVTTSFATSSSTWATTATSNVSTPLIATETTSSSQVSTSDSLNTSSTSTTPVDHLPITEIVTSGSTSTSVTSLSTFSSVPSSSSGSDDSINTSDTQVLAPTSTVPVLAAASSGFWSNKSAVAGTFTVVALIIVALLAGLFTFLIKRKNRYKADYGGYERYPEPDSGASIPPSETNTSELHHAPMDPFADPTSYLNVQVQDHNIPQQLPAASYSKPHLPPSMATNDDDLYDPFATPNPRIVPASTLTSVTTLTPGHPYASSRGKLAPVNFKESVERDSHRPSIDSFYGAVDSSEQAGTAH